MARVCEEYKKWVEEKIEEPVKKRKKGARERCKKKRCKKWCLYCNKWICWIETFFYWVVEWVVRIVGKWVPYVVCRIISAVITLAYLFVWALKQLWCLRHTKPTMRQNLDLLPMRRLQLEIVIIDKDESIANPITNAAIDAQIGHADRILQETAKIKVKRRGGIRRETSSSLYEVDQSFSEWLKGSFLLIGRGSPLYLTVYVVGNVKGENQAGLHLPLHGSVFVDLTTLDTTLCHELGHALLSIDKMGHSDIHGNLMFEPAKQREVDCNWPTDVPTLTIEQWRSMRRSRWLDWYWDCDVHSSSTPKPPIGVRVNPP